ncbi:MAG: hypothetical protein D6755_03620 [Anaerolineae bacterium]|nr:MAG: hypothetical protein D6755_03620 [Anaerolineae bacterium]
MGACFEFLYAKENGRIEFTINAQASIPKSVDILLEIRCGGHAPPVDYAGFVNATCTPATGKFVQRS